MKNILLSLLLGCWVWALRAQNYVENVNPLMGTESTFDFSGGNTYPVIARPWGMNFWTPRTGKMGDGWIYTYTSHQIVGFNQTHQPSPWINDYGTFSLMPVTGKVELDEMKRASWFSHKSETVSPYYYKVYLANYDVVTEMAPTTRAAMFRFTFPESDARVVVDAYYHQSHIKIVPEENKIVGYTTHHHGGVPHNFKNYFVIQFDRPFTYQATFSNDGMPEKGKDMAALTLKEGVLEQTEYHTGAVIGFKTRRGEQVHARVASSFVSAQQAELNLEELGNRSFDEVVDEGKRDWNRVLGKVEVEGGSLDQRRVFYTCLYRSLLFPRKFYEINERGEVVHYSPYNGKVLPGYLYADSGFWDTFRSLFPLLNLVYPSVNREIQEGLLNAYRESGFFPEWASPGHRGCMVGNNSASILVDAYMKGIRVDDLKLLYEGLVHGTEHVHPTVSSTGRLGHEYYNTLGYVPCDVGIAENAARTLEYAYDDWCIWRLAKKLKRPQQEIRKFAQRAMNYRQLFRKEHNLMCGKQKNGQFEENFSPLKWGGNFTEGNSWHYTWSVFHDPQGLIDLMGGKDVFVSMLDSVFTVPPVYDDSYYGFPIHEIREMMVMNMGNYAHGNQPIQHMVYLYNYGGAPWKAQYWVREVMNRMYTPAPDGYCGDEDNGQTSAWYVFSALGFYPVCPGTDEYVLGAPLFKKAVVHLENGKDICIVAPDNDDANRYIQRMTLNGQPYTKNYLTFSDLTKGVDIQIQMKAVPNKARGVKASDAPYSFSNDFK